METREREMETLKAKLVNSNATIDTLQQGPKKIKEKEEKLKKHTKLMKNETSQSPVLPLSAP
jgi:hypothetical protein